jgi:hypothetical protein
MTGKTMSRGNGLILAAFCAAALLVLPGKAAQAQSSSEGGNQSQAQTAQASSSTAKPNLTGTWILNRAQSDDPRAKMQQAMGVPSGGTGGGIEGRYQDNGRTGRGPTRGGMMAEFSKLTIEQSNGNVKITGASGQELATTQPETNKAESNQADENNAGMGARRFAPATAEWQGNQLVAKSEGFGRGTTTRTYELSPDGKQLYVSTKIENERLTQPVTYRQVYDPAKSENNNQ